MISHLSVKTAGHIHRRFDIHIQNICNENVGRNAPFLCNIDCLLRYVLKQVFILLYRKLRLGRLLIQIDVIQYSKSDSESEHKFGSG